MSSPRRNGLAVRPRPGARSVGRARSRSVPKPAGERPAVAADGIPSRARVAELQRARILTAMSELVRERGAAGVTVAHIVARSGVSRRTFYELFTDRDGCLLAAFDHAVECARRAAIPAYGNAGGSWEAQVRAALGALLEFLDAEPALGGLLVVDALAAEHRVLERRARVLDAVVDAVHRGARRRVTPGTRKDTPPRIVAEGAVGAVLAVIHARLLERNSRPLGGLLNPLMGIVVLPYLGPAAAERELARPMPKALRPSPKPADPLRQLDMRLTYRTVRVLLAIAERPASSGRQVADASGISDQGQISKLLARLRDLGLVHNAAAGRGKGEPNAWTLTAKGRAVEHAIRAQSAA